MNYFNPQMNDSYCLYKIASALTIDYNSIFTKLYYFLKNNNDFEFFCQSSNIIQKNNSYFLLYKFKKEFQCIDQIVLQFDINNDNINYQISIYTKQAIFDNKFYYPIQKILNNSTKTFDSNDPNLLQNLKQYFCNVFDKYFKIYRQNVDNGLYV